ncbi:hypothetical protein L2Y94_05485 [Luteibacter aegosomatis]|uniref:hypothetical protein n=1 Tax=Luteibacter aegosomatis TaxID=2911537 RepID=UPI001FF99288|nr:hypothetical protein [Luteibacter aegosomatis]UPG86807.1 hypothetical protein L2Y94_05485 [Luteibacter aegosomatis]
MGNTIWKEATIISSRANSFPGFVVAIDADVGFAVGQKLWLSMNDPASQPAEQPRGEGYDVARHNDWLERNAQPKPVQAVGDGVDEEDERRKFEAWYVPEFSVPDVAPISMEREAHGRYKVGMREAYWQGWLARAKVAEVECPLPRPAVATPAIFGNPEDGAVQRSIREGFRAAFDYPQTAAEAVAVLDACSDPLTLTFDHVKSKHCANALRSVVASYGRLAGMQIPVATPAEVTDEMMKAGVDAYEECTGGLSIPEEGLRVAIRAALTAQCRVRKDGKGVEYVSADELARLLAIEHHAWHLLDDSGDHGDGYIRVSSGYDFDELSRLLPEGHPEYDGVVASPSAGAVVPEGCALVRATLTLPIANALGYDAKFNTWEEMQEVWGNALLAAAPEVPRG